MTMSAYDPFQRGEHPVGVRTFDVSDASRGRTLPVEFWYPATDAHRGQDLDPETQDRYRPIAIAPETSQAAVRAAAARDGRFPLVLFSHGYSGERRQTTHFCTHLASHGFAVASPDHVGNTMADTLQQAMKGQTNMRESLEIVRHFIRDRPLDASFVLDRVVAGDGPVQVDPDRIGMTGHSFGGWTTLQTTARDSRIRAALPLAPAGGSAPFSEGGNGTNPLRDQLDLGWSRKVPTLYLVAEFDTLLPLDGMRELIARTPQPRRAVVLRNSDHFHFCDAVEQIHDLFKTMGPMFVASSPDPEVTGALFESMKTSAELCPGEHAYAMIRGLGLAHMDASLRENEEAAKLLAGDLAALLAARGIEAEGIG
jgi:dienelactone hydrolase